MNNLISHKKLYQAIFKRKSVRKYRQDKLDTCQLTAIEDFLEQTKALNQAIKFESKLVDSAAVKSLFSIKAPYYIQFFSETKADYLLNAGFILQQLDLYLAANNLGSCWFGMAKAKKEIRVESDLEYVITLAFGKAAEKSQRDSIEDFERKTLAEIKKGANHYELLEAARLAPSATNGQPWYFISEAEQIHLYQQNPNFIKKFFYQKLNKIDMGVVLAHIWLAAEQHGQNFELKKLQQIPQNVKKYNYLLTIKV